MADRNTSNSDHVSQLPAHSSARWASWVGTAVVALAVMALVIVGSRFLTTPETLAQSPKGKGGGGGGPQAAAVEAEPVIERQLAEGQTFVGTLTPLRRSVVGSAVDGRVVEYFVNEGDWVTKGQPLAQLLTKTIQIEIAGAKAELALRQQELNELEAGSRPEEIAQAEAKVRQNEALMLFAKEKRRRWQRLYEQGNSTSLESLEEANSAATAAEQAYLAAKAEYELAVKGPREERIAQARAQRDTAQEQVNLLEDRLEKYAPKAPFDGYVVAEYTEVGAWINKGDKIAEVIEVDPIEVTVSVPEHHIDGLQQSMAAAFAKNDLPSADTRLSALQGKTFPSKVVRIVPQADLRARTFPVKVHVPNPSDQSGHSLKAGMLAKVTLPVGTPRPSILVPKDALVIQGVGHSVFVVVQNPQTKMATVREVPVELGLSDGPHMQVRGDLKAGQQVVTRGNERLRSGMPVQIINAPSAAAATAARN